jgi:signal transduction histidine kinase
MSSRLVSRHVLAERLTRLPRVRDGSREWLRDTLHERWQGSRPASSGRRETPAFVFELATGAICAIVPLAVLVPLHNWVEPILAGVVLMLGIALATHLGEWLGAVTAITIGLFSINVFWGPGRVDSVLPGSAGETVTLIVIGLSGLVLAWLIQGVKGESVTARRDASAARSATFALNSIEADAAAYARGGIGNRTAIYGSLLRAMIAANRAAFGVLLLSNERDLLVPVAGYGLDAFDADDLAPEFLAEIVVERRLRTISDVSRDERFENSEFEAAGVRSLMGAPIFDEGDQIVGIVLTGLHAVHRFTSAETYRLAALTEKAASIFDALEAVDERESALQEAEAQQIWLESVIAAIPEAVLLIDPVREQVMAQNAAAATLLGELAGRRATSAYARLLGTEGESFDPSESPLGQAVSAREILTGTEMLAIRTDGAQIPVLVSAAPVIQDPGARMQAVVAVFREISALKEASRLKDEFVSIVSHELRSPLTPIRGFVQLVARDLARKGGNKEHIQRLNSAAGHVDRMTRLVDDLLDVSRLKAGSLDLRRSTVDILDICREVVADRLAGEMRQSLVFDESPASVTGFWDPDRLYQVIDNLVGNAVKYSPPDGRITISVAGDVDRNTASVTVSDEGPGIAVEEREQVFSAFFRTRDAARGQVAGLGLGLYICQELVTAHGGTISIEESTSGGAALTVTLPIAAAVEELEPASVA